MSDVVNAKLRSTGATDEKASGVKQILGMVEVRAERQTIQAHLESCNPIHELCIYVQQ